MQHDFTARPSRRLVTSFGALCVVALSLLAAGCGHEASSSGDLDDADEQGPSPDSDETEPVTGTVRSAIVTANPKGYHDTIGATLTEGWACDPDNYALPLSVHFYEGSAYLGSTVANVQRETAVGSACGGNRNHGFRWTLPSFLRDGRAHTVTAYAINVTASGAPGGANPRLTNSPKTIPGNPPPPAIRNVGTGLCMNFSSGLLVAPCSGASAQTDVKVTAYQGYRSEPSLISYAGSFITIPGTNLCVTARGDNAVSLATCSRADFILPYQLFSRAGGQIRINFRSDNACLGVVAGRLWSVSCAAGDIARWD